MQRFFKINWKIMLVVCLVFILEGGEFKVYPKAKLNEEETKAAQEMADQAGMKNTRIAIYMSDDEFKKVVAFYKQYGREIKMPHASGSDGQPKQAEDYQLWEAWFVFDDSSSLKDSKCWIKVQYPYIGEEIINKTGILLTEKIKK